MSELGNILAYFLSISSIIVSVGMFLLSVGKAPGERKQAEESANKIRAEAIGQWEDNLKKSHDLITAQNEEIQKQWKEINDLKSQNGKYKTEIDDLNNKYKAEIDDLKADQQTIIELSRAQQSDMNAKIERQEKRLKALEEENCLLNEWTMNLVKQIQEEFKGIPVEKPKQSKRSKI